MVRRFIIIASLVLIPTAVYGVTADQLGPQTNSPGVSDPGTTNLLQPASPGQGSLQAPRGQESGLQSPDQTNLQPAGEREQINSFLSGEGGGAVSDEADSDAPFSALQLGLLVMMLVTAGWLGWSWLRQRGLRLSENSAVASAEPGTDLEMPAPTLSAQQPVQPAADKPETATQTTPEPVGAVQPAIMQAPIKTKSKRSRRKKRY